MFVETQCIASLPDIGIDFVSVETRHGMSLQSIITPHISQIITHISTIKIIIYLKIISSQKIYDG